MEDNKLIKVVNRTTGTVGYTIPDMQNLHRNYTAKEEKTISFEELRKLAYVPGGEYLIKNYLIIKDKDAIEALNLHIEPEYFYTEKEVKDLMEHGSLDQFLDCLDFAPDGVLDLIKDVAVKLPLNDVAKRKAILDKLNFNVDKAIEIKSIAEEPEAPAGVGRRAAVPGQEEKNESKGSTSGRRVVIKTE